MRDASKSESLSVAIYRGKQLSRNQFYVKTSEKIMLATVFVIRRLEAINQTMFRKASLRQDESWRR